MKIHGHRHSSCAEIGVRRLKQVKRELNIRSYNGLSQTLYVFEEIY